MLCYGQHRDCVACRYYPSTHYRTDPAPHSVDQNDLLSSQQPPHWYVGNAHHLDGASFYNVAAEPQLSDVASPTWPNYPLPLWPAAVPIDAPQFNPAVDPTLAPSLSPTSPYYHPLATLPLPQSLHAPNFSCVVPPREFQNAEVQTPGLREPCKRPVRVLVKEGEEPQRQYDAEASKPHVWQPWNHGSYRPSDVETTPTKFDLAHDSTLDFAGKSLCVDRPSLRDGSLPGTATPRRVYGQQQAEPSSGKKRFACDMCDRGFCSKDYLQIHRRMHTGERPFACDWPSCNLKFARKCILNQHRRIHTGEKKFACDMCGKKFANRQQVTVHMRTHTGEKPYVCDWPSCGQKFAQSSHLTSHTSTHTGEKNFACDVCGKKFANRQQVTVHMRTHTGEKPYACHWPSCGQSFARRKTLAKHTSTHTGEKRFACDMCGKKFAHRQQIIAHIRSHSGEKPFACDWPSCDRKFMWRTMLKRHMCTHTGEKPFTCDWPSCGKKFTYNWLLKNHVSTHTSVKNFACDACGKKFAQLKTLSAHKCSHAGEKPLACDWPSCGQRFAQRRTLVRHTSTHHDK